MHLESWRWVLFRCSSKVGAILYELLLGRTTLVAPWGTFVITPLFISNDGTSCQMLYQTDPSIACQEKISDPMWQQKLHPLYIIQNHTAYIVVLSMTIWKLGISLSGYCCCGDSVTITAPVVRTPFSGSNPLQLLAGSWVVPPNGLRYLEDSPNWNGGSIDAIDVNHGQSKWSTDNWIILDNI